MELQEIIKSNYNIEPVIKIEKTVNGSGNSFLVRTKHEKYIAKTNEKTDFIQIYEKVQNKLNHIDLLQSRVIHTKNNLLIATEGIVLYEYIDGDTYTSLNYTQSKNAIEYMKEYNKALRLVSFNKEELIMKNHWDKVKSIDFLIHEFSFYLTGLEIQYRKNINDAIDILINITRVNIQNKQLIHSDLGADNFIFKNDKVISIIDFSPDYNHEIYSLCQFIYWNYLWNATNISRETMNTYFRIYNSGNDDQLDEDMFKLLLLYSALYRIAGPLMDILNRNVNDYGRLKKRFQILEKLLVYCIKETKLT